MKNNAIKDYSARELDRMALDLSDVKPMSASMRRKWEAAKETGKRMHRRIGGGGLKKLRPRNRVLSQFRSIQPYYPRLIVTQKA